MKTPKMNGITHTFDTFFSSLLVDCKVQLLMVRLVYGIIQVLVRDWQSFHSSVTKTQAGSCMARPLITGKKRMS